MGYGKHMWKNMWLDSQHEVDMDSRLHKTRNKKYKGTHAKNMMVLISMQIKCGWEERCEHLYEVK